MQLEIPRTMKTSQGAVNSLVLTSGAVGTATFGRSNKLVRLHGNMASHPQPNTRRPRGFRIFNPRSKSSRSKKREAFVLPSSTVHPFVVQPNALLDDADSTSECSDSTSASWNHSVSHLDALHYESSLSRGGVSTGYPHAVTETVAEENEECGDFETQSETEPATPPSQPPATFVDYYRRPSLPRPTPIPIAGQTRFSMSLDDLPGSLYHKRPTSSESWDTDFDLGSTEIQVPSSVEDSQLSIRMDMYNIRDFTNHIETLKSLRAKRNQLYNKLGNTWPIARSRLESTYSTCWEEADVIIDLSDSVPPTFDGGRSITVGVQHKPSDRRLEVLKKLFDDDVNRSSPGLDDDSSDDDFFTDADEKSTDDEDDDFVMIPWENACDTLEIDDSDKENCACATTELGTRARTSRSVDSADEHGCVSDDKDGERTRHEEVRISVEAMPGLIDHLRHLHQRLSQHVDQLTVAARMTDSVQE